MGSRDARRDEDGSEPWHAGCTGGSDLPEGCRGEYDRSDPQCGRGLSAPGLWRQGVPPRLPRIYVASRPQCAITESMSHPAGNEPKVCPQSPSRREAQNASAIAAGPKRINSDASSASASLSATRRALPLNIQLKCGSSRAGATSRFAYDSTTTGKSSGCAAKAGHTDIRIYGQGTTLSKYLSQEVAPR